jgi:tetratricopeptide (TPR) repeat protein
MSTQPHLPYEYQVGGALEVDAPSYVVRQADDDLYNALKAGKFCYVLNSRQMGKSSLRVQTRRRLEKENVACASIDLTGIGSEDATSDKWYTGIIYELNSNFSLEIDLRTWLREHKEFNPVHRLREFIEQVLLGSVRQDIVIFVDEIDSVLALNFGIDDFFAFIRFCYNQRAEQPEYKRLTFALLGVATPPDLIRDKNRTPFNIGHAIELNGFQFQESQLLAQGLVNKTSNPQTVLREVLAWTGGQPFLTQKLCQLVLDAESLIPSGEEELWIENLVRSHIIENWESQDEPEHLRTIRDRILRNEQRAGRLLGLYQQILQHGKIAADNSYDHIELRLSGLVVEQQGKLRVYNRIYEFVFNQAWVDKALVELRPYAEAITAWLAAGCKDESRLLRGQALRDAQSWGADKSLSAEDEKFLDASRELDKREMQIALAVKEEESRILAEANLVLSESQKKAKRMFKKALAGLVVMFLLSLLGFSVLMPRLYHTYNKLGLRGYYDGHLDEALENFNWALKLNPNSSEAHFNRGLVYEKLGEFDRASDDYQKAMKGGLEAAYSQLAHLYITEKIPGKNSADAVKLLLPRLALRKDIDIDVQYAMLKNLGLASLKQNRYEAAKHYLQMAIELNKQLPIEQRRASAYCLLAELFEERSNETEALVQWKECLRYLSIYGTPNEKEWFDKANQRLKTQTKKP